jgi:hypothetical protein
MAREVPEWHPASKLTGGWSLALSNPVPHAPLPKSDGPSRCPDFFPFDSGA